METFGPSMRKLIMLTQQDKLIIRCIRTRRSWGFMDERG